MTKNCKLQVVYVANFQIRPRVQSQPILRYLPTLVREGIWLTVVDFIELLVFRRVHHC